jgi:hypothetical protein
METPPPGALGSMRRVGNVGNIVSNGDIETVLLIEFLSLSLEGFSMTYFCVRTIEQQAIVDHLMHHDTSEGFLVKIVIVGHENGHMLVRLTFPTF